MKRLCTIGHNGKSLRRFVELLRQAGVQQLVDIRLRNTSQLVGFAKKDDLAYLLQDLLGIEYVHVPGLAPTPEILDRYHKDKDWAAYEAAFLPVLAERDAVSLLSPSLAALECVCLLCSEETPERCHRRLVAEFVAASTPEVEIVHL